MSPPVRSALASSAFAVELGVGVGVAFGDGVGVTSPGCSDPWLPVPVVSVPGAGVSSPGVGDASPGTLRRTMR